MTHDIHIIGGGLAGSEAAWQLAEAGLRVHLSEMRGGGDSTPAHETDRLAEMVCSNSFRSDDADQQRRRPAPPGNARPWLAGDARRGPPPRSRRFGAGGGSRCLRSRSDRRGEWPPQHHGSARADRRSARPSNDHRHRPADRFAARGVHRLRDRERRTRLFRCHRAHRPPRQRRHGRLLDGRPLGSWFGRGGRQGLHQLPDGPRPVRSLRRRAQRRRKDRIQGMGARHALFRRLHADRGDGGARAGDPSPRAR